MGRGERETCQGKEGRKAGGARGCVSLSSVEGNVLDNYSFRISQWPLFLLMCAVPAILKTRMVLKLKMELGLLGTRAEVVWGENIQTVWKKKQRVNHNCWFLQLSIQSEKVPKSYHLFTYSSSWLTNKSATVLNDDPFLKDRKMT